MKKLITAALCCIVFLTCTNAQTFSLVSTYNTDKQGSSPTNFTTIGTTTFFTITNMASNTYELWKTDATAGGTVLVKSFPIVSLTSGIYYLNNLNGTLVFAADDGVSGMELWKSDGTAAGTAIIKDLYPGISAGVQTGQQLYRPIVIGSVMYFVGRETSSTFSIEIFRTDGTSAGTTLLKDIATSFSNQSAGWLTNVNGTLFFEARDNNGYQIWKSDGTTAGTVKVTNGSYGVPASLTNVNGTLFFTDTEKNLYKSDGTLAGTVLVKTISRVVDLISYNSNLYFTADDSTTYGYELWKSDGTTAGTTIVKDIFSGFGSSAPASLVVVGPLLYFTATTSTEGRELWKTDGSTAGTTIVKDIATGAVNGVLQPKETVYSRYAVTVGSSTIIYTYGHSIETLYNINDTLFFSADDGINGTELWKSDGTATGTVMVKNISSLNNSSFPSDINVTTNGSILFAATDGINGPELWKTDGTSTGTSLVKDIVTTGDPFSNSIYAVNSFYFSYFADNNGSFYFTGKEGKYAEEPYKSSGTIATTGIVKDVNPNSNGSDPSNYTQVGSTVFFTATSELGTELWKTDGTSTGTVLVKDIYPGSFGSYPSNLTKVGSLLFFVAIDGTHGRELWKSDGTSAGTVLVKDITPGILSSGFNGFTEFNGKLAFIGVEAVYGQELWISDGTEAGTNIVKDINPSTTDAGAYGIPSFMTVSGSYLYFVGSDPATGNELWKTDGTSAGTVLVKDIVAGVNSSTPSNLTSIVGGTVFFTAQASGVGNELWKSDGTSAGTVLVKDIYSGTSSANPNFLVANGNTLYFAATDATNGTEMWKSDGTSAGTVLVKDINAGTNPSVLSRSVKVGPWMFFFATDGSTSALWRTDGTSSGTTKVTDFETGGILSSLTPNYLALSGTSLYATPRTASYGNGIWAADVSSLLPVQDLKLSAILKNNTTAVNWTAINEINLEKYIVQRSTDGSHFNAIGHQTAKGGGNYVFTDSLLPNGANKIFYRLQCLDKDGSIQYSKVVVVSLSIKSLFSIYPNPAKNTLFVEGKNMQQVSITDNAGKVVLKQTMSSSTMALDISTLSKGLYFVTAIDMDGRTTTKSLIVE